MANDYFRFKNFTIHQSRCAMKVGTDGTLLGAWANGGRRVLDIGTGTGLVALMMAQRFPLATVVGVEVDKEAAAQAQENVLASPFAERVKIVEGDINNVEWGADGVFDAVVCNPPYFVDSLVCPDRQRATARHAASLTYGQLMACGSRWLTDDGEFSLIIPFDCKAQLESEASLAGLFKVRECAVQTTPQKPPRRYLLTFGRHPRAFVSEVGVISHGNARSEWYQELTKAFYL